MKLIIIASALLSGGGLAMQNETVKEEVKERFHQARERFQERRHNNIVESIKENGVFPYPSEEKLANLTEEQQFEIISAIDQINATYDWVNMTDEEIEEALEVIKEEMKVLKEELGIETQPFKDRFKRRMKQRLLEELREEGIPYPNEDRLANLTEEQQEAIIAKTDELNETYDWANMTDEEIKEALQEVKDEFNLLFDELGIDFPKEQRQRKHHHNQQELPIETNNEA